MQLTSRMVVGYTWTENKGPTPLVFFLYNIPQFVRAFKGNLDKPRMEYKKRKTLHVNYAWNSRKPFKNLLKGYAFHIITYNISTSV